MSRQINRPGVPSYGATSDDPDVIFGGDNRELRLMCDSVSTNVYSINSSSRYLQGALTTLGTARDTQGLRDQVHVAQLSANQLVKATTADVAKLTKMARSASKVHKLQADKIIGHFTEAVQGYSKIQVAVAEKLRNSLPRQQSTTDDDRAPLLEEETRQQLQLQQDLQFDAELLAEREERVQQIESDILDVNQLMRELGALVHEQSNTIDSIESNIESTRGNVETAGSELRTAARYQNKSRKQKLFLLVVVCVVLAILIGIIVWSSR